jgi:hypothetical protein
VRSASERGRLQGPNLGVLRRLEAEGVRTVLDVLGRAEGVRDLPGRSNYRLRVSGLLIHVKRTKRRAWRRRLPAIPPEAEGIAVLMMAGLPTAFLVFVGTDPEFGCVTGTLDLAPARPLDAVLKEGGLRGVQRRRLLRDLAAAVGRLHGSCHHHRDLYLNHVFVDPDPEPPRFTFIDLERVASHRRPYSRRVVKDLAALHASSRTLVSDRERLAFLAAYLRERGALSPRLLRRLKGRIVRRSRRIQRHVPRTPVGDAAPRPAPIRPR